MDLQSKIILMFTGMGGAAGAISAVLQNSWLALLIVLALFYAAYKFAPEILKFQSSEFPPMERLKKGFVPLFLTWLIVWVMVYTVFMAR
jgi:hypothetical protein